MDMDTLKALLKAKLKDTASYETIGREYGVNRGVIWYIIHRNYEPKNNEIRRRLGLPERFLVFRTRGPNGRFR